VPNYHPDWCKSLLNRKTWIFIGYPHGSMFENRNEIYVKPARCVKQFDARLVSRNDVDSLNKYRSFYCSESITGGFKEEYRYYVANGVVINQFCYKTNDTNVDHSDIAAPLFHEITDVIIPSDFTGTVDLAIGAKDGKIYLVETHEPYSIGWYGDIDIKSVEQYVNFLSIGWSYLTSKYGKNVKNN
jgi:hypothetical protein